jgi:2TM domain
MSATISPQHTAEPGDDPTIRADAELREAAIANLKRRRKFVEDAIAYVAVNGVLWLIWALTDRSADGVIPWPAWVSLIWGFLLAIDAWRAFGRWPASLHRPITEEDIQREIRQSRGS